MLKLAATTVNSAFCPKIVGYVKLQVSRLFSLNMFLQNPSFFQRFFVEFFRCHLFFSYGVKKISKEKFVEDNLAASSCYFVLFFRQISIFRVWLVTDLKAMKAD